MNFLAQASNHLVSNYRPETFNTQQLCRSGLPAEKPQITSLVHLLVVPLELDLDAAVSSITTII